MLWHKLIGARKTAGIELIGFTTVASENGIVSSIDTPTDTSVGDLIFISSSSGDNTDSSLLSGFTQAGVSTESDKQLVQYLQYVSTPPASYTGYLPISGGDDYVSIAMSIRNAVVDVVGSMVVASTASAVTATGITVTEDSSWLLCFAAIRRAGATPPYISTPSGFTEIAQINFSGGNNPAIAVFYKEVDAGATGDVTVTFNVSDRVSAMLLSIKPA